ncbi:MAG: 2-amino-4-hydroxy-6-hydroxymethyldihydropteridine diphosphokinase [Syntrophomonadaceae bacterium]|nr:2-amino-4-hydroxy-6-hydroxymethyldihydropteridine diphosphokinase [Syntrophomonadaceae bacterium]
MKRDIYIGLGSNMGFKRRNIETAIDNIEKIPGVDLVKKSSLYETDPWGKTDQDKFLNQVIMIETALGADELLDYLLEIEIKMGRQRLEKWGPRVIDLDILLYGNQVIQTDRLRVPHPHMRERLFVLIPLQEIGTDLRFPEDGITIEEVLSRVLARDGNTDIRKI